MRPDQREARTHPRRRLVLRGKADDPVEQVTRARDRAAPKPGTASPRPRELERRRLRPPHGRRRPCSRPRAPAGTRATEPRERSVSSSRARSAHRRHHDEVGARRSRDRPDARHDSVDPPGAADEPAGVDQQERRPRQVAWTSSRSRVTPGVSCAMAWRRPNSRFSSVDLPTFWVRRSPPRGAHRSSSSARGSGSRAVDAGRPSTSATRADRIEHPAEDLPGVQFGRVDHEGVGRRLVGNRSSVALRVPAREGLGRSRLPLRGPLVAPQRGGTLAPGATRRGRSSPRRPGTRPNRCRAPRSPRHRRRAGAALRAGRADVGVTMRPPRPSTRRRGSELRRDRGARRRPRARVGDSPPREKLAARREPRKPGGIRRIDPCPAHAGRASDTSIRC